MDVDFSDKEMERIAAAADREGKDARSWIRETILECANRLLDKTRNTIDSERIEGAELISDSTQEPGQCCKNCGEPISKEDSNEFGGCCSMSCMDDQIAGYEARQYDKYSQ